MAYRWRVPCTILAALAASLVLSGCEPPSDATQPSYQLAQADRASPQGGAAASDTGSTRRVAVSHAFSLRLPSREVASVQRRHLEVCANLGCLVLKTGFDQFDGGQARADTSVRIAPNRYSEFVAVLSAPPATVGSHTETAEDQTLPSLDAEKRLAAKTALRDRLAAMLRDPAPKSVTELVAIEKELTQVQGDIETITAQRDHLLTITETVKVDIRYFGTVAQAGGFDVSRIIGAIDRIGETVVASIAALISFVAMVVPWLPVLALVVWTVRRALRRWRRAKALGLS